MYELVFAFQSVEGQRQDCLENTINVLTFQPVPFNETRYGPPTPDLSLPVTSASANTILQALPDVYGPVTNPDSIDNPFQVALEHWLYDGWQHLSQGTLCSVQEKRLNNESDLFLILGRILVFSPLLPAICVPSNVRFDVPLQQALPEQFVNYNEFVGISQTESTTIIPPSTQNY